MVPCRKEKKKYFFLHVQKNMLQHGTYPPTKKTKQKQNKNNL